MTDVKQLPTTSTSKHYFGLFLGNGVKILDYEDGVDLYRHGCYGKGNLSRSTPSYAKIKNDLTLSYDFHFKKMKTRPASTQGQQAKKRKPDETKESTQERSKNDRLKQQKTGDGKEEFVNPQGEGGEREEEAEYDEFVQLSLCEAFFLIYALGCLTILREAHPEEQGSDHPMEGTPEKTTLYRMSIKECWCEFLRNDKEFLFNYLVYQYFRSNEWIPKSGLKYGCHFVLYKLKPELVHAQYGVIIQREYKNHQAISHNPPLRQPENKTPREQEPETPCTNTNTTQTLASWEGVLAANRVSENVAKGILLCNVIVPDALKYLVESLTSSTPASDKVSVSSELLLSALTQFKINIWELNRWVPAKTRQ